METNGRSVRKSDTKTAAKLSVTRGKTSLGTMFKFLSLAWFLTECLLSYAVVLLILVPLIPFIVLVYILRTVERVTSGGKPLTGTDALFQQSIEENRLAINAVVSIEYDSSLEEFLKNFRQAILERMVDAKKDNGEIQFPRARCYIRPGLFQYFFQEDKSFQIENHVFPWEGDVPRSKDELAAIVSKLSNEPFPEGRSPWYVCCVPTNFGDNDFATVFRMSHSIADGVALARFLICKLPDQRTPEKVVQKFSSIGRSLLLAKALLILPRYLFKTLFTFADHSLLHGPDLSGVKKVAWHEAFELQLIKKIKAATGTTVNDVLMSCLSLALRRYFQRKGVANPDDFTAAVPVDVRSKASWKDLAFENKFSLVFPKLAVATEGVLKQLYETKRRMDQTKVSGDPLASAVIISLSNELLPEFLIRQVNAFVTKKASCILSNVPGPQHMLTVKGKHVKYITFWPPQKDNVGVGLSIFTYAGQVIVGVQGDVSVLSDPEIIIEEFGNAVKEMAQCVLHSNGTVSDGHATQQNTNGL